MVKYLLVIFYMFCVNIFADPYSEVAKDDLEYIRETFYAAVDSENSLDELAAYIDEKFTEDKESYPVLVLAYEGGLQSLKAKYSPFPISKFIYVKKALKILESAIEEAPENLEIRFLRFAILHNIPSIMGYGKERKNDAQLIVDLLLKKNFANLDLNSQKDITKYMLDSGRLTEDQTVRLEDNFLALNE